ncbi:hypothetical protein [Hymenobacter cellulosivorans]|uniref:Fibronectin type-III domain-containing protein n=1 Tax=Hymenobacter cellulosivorans TaxID=2932249 RepID=A0ABY4F8Q5_9BACT|nr:hypothetical protein [Hymenobacter cellulosivorans]UOQ53049.1 hypothetical protein MUN80_25345 [Hymenobacter cellulosivorans]
MHPSYTRTRLLTALLLLLLSLGARAQTPYALSNGTYSENFSQISSWANGFASGTGAAPYSVATGSPTLPNQNTVFSTGTSGGVQRGTQAIVLLATGSDNANAAAFDLNLDFTGTSAGTVSLDWASVNNSTGNRQSTFKLQTNTGTGGAFVDLPGSSVVLTNNTASAGQLSALALPAAFTNNAAAKIRFYIQPTAGGTNPSGSRPKVSLDNLTVTATTGGPVTPTITTGTITGSPFCVTATAGAAVAVPFTATGGLTGTFAAQLSDAAGQFPAELTQSLIGTGSASPIAATLPAGTAAGTSYRIRVVHAATGTIGQPNPAALTVTSPPTANGVTLSSTAAQSITTTGTGTTLTATAAAPSSFAWFYGTSSTGPFPTALSGATAASYTPKGSDFAGAGTYYLVARATSTCGSVEGTSTPVRITVTAPAPVLTITPQTVPDFGSVYVGSASSAQPVVVSGSNLTAPVTVTPAPGFEIRTGSAPFACCAITLTPQAGTLSSTTIDVRFVPALAQVYSATLPVSSADLPTQEPVAVSGTGVAPIFPATVQTSAVSAITATQATAGGTVSDEGNSAVTERGVVYSLTANPTLANEPTVDGAGSGPFTSLLTGLKPNTRYYVRAYATNEVGTSYGEEVSFTTASVALAAEPTQSSTLTASQLTPTSVLLTASGGTGSKRLFLATQAADLLAGPTDGTTYAGNSTVGQGDQPAPSIYVVAAGPATSVTVTGLQPNTEYTFAVFDYNDDNTPGAENYRTQDPGKLTLTTPEQPAQLLLEENFLYAAAEPLTDHGWNAQSAPGTNPVRVSSAGLSRADYNATGGNAAALTATGEDVHRTFAPVAAGTPVYAAFLVQVSSSPAGDYFFHLGPDPISTTFRARVLVRPVAATDKIQFGVSGSGTTAVYDPTEYELGTPYLLVVRYSFGSTGTETRLYVNPGVAEPTNSNATSREAATSAPANIGAVALRQGNSTSPLLLDGLRVGTTFGVVRQQLPAPLPVQLVRFTGQVQQRAVVLRWTTAQELRNDRFEVERAQGDGQAFTRVATVAGRGTTTTTSSYAYTDADVLRPGQRLYYRLRQVDQDGQAIYSPVVAVSAGANGAQALRAVPNPARDQVRLEGATADVAQVLDLTGRLLRTVNTRELISLQGLTPGIYLIRCGTSATRLQVE